MCLSALTLLVLVQVAKQQGEYLAGLLGKGQVRQGRDIPPQAKPFKYAHKGSLAYVGSDKAVMDVPSVGPIFGWGAGAGLLCCAPQIEGLRVVAGLLILQVWDADQHPV